MPEKTKSVLLVEDEPALQEAIKLKLEQSGIKVFAFTTAEEAAAFLAKGEATPTIVWLDILLPGMNGLEFLKQIREDMHLKDLPVIIVSVSASQEKMKQAFKLNVVDFIVKSDDNLRNIIHKVMGIMENLK